MNDSSPAGKILHAYAVSNIAIHGTSALSTDRFMWLAIMGMLDTLILLDIDAEIWDEYNG